MIMVCVMLCLLLLPVQSAAAQVGKARLIDPEGKETGRAVLSDTPAGVLVRLELTDFPSGTHAFHIHEIGKCDAPSFASAGGHFNPFNKDHGFIDPDGRHAGDLPNIHVPSSGSLTVEVLAAQTMLLTGETELMDANGSALVVHSGADDYRTDPAGAAGERIACGVIMLEESGIGMKQ